MQSVDVSKLLEKAKKEGLCIVDHYLSYQESGIMPFSSDASLIASTPLIVFRPECKEEAIHCVRFCIENKIKITVRGGGTSLTGSAVPLNSAVIDVSKLDSFDIDEEKKICICEPGVILKDLNDYLKKHNLFFPVVPSSENACTIGGMISTNASGLRSVKFGSMKDWIDEVIMINGKGKVVICGNEICGLEGTLGLILETKLRITDIFVERSMNLIDIEVFEKIPEVIRELKKNEATMIEYLDKYSCEKIGIESEGDKGCIIACFENEVGDITSEKEIRKIIGKREGVYPVLANEGRFLIEDPRMDIEKIPKLLQFLENLNTPVFGHIGVGILHPCFKPQEKEKIHDLYRFVKENNGWISGEHGYGIRKKEFIPECILKKWRDLKKKHDPSGFFNPGKIGDEIKAEFKEYALKENLKCVNCGLCKICPVFKITKKEEIGPRARAFFNEAPYYCTLCKACEVSCPLSFNMREKVLELRHELVKRKIEIKEIKEMIERIKRYGNPFGKEAKEGEWYCC